MYSFSYLEPVYCSMSSSNYCFLTCIQVSHEAGEVVWYCHLFQNFPQFIVIHTVKGFGRVNKAEVDVFLEFSCFSMIQRMLAIWSPVPLPFLTYQLDSPFFSPYVPKMVKWDFYLYMSWIRVLFNQNKCAKWLEKVAVCDRKEHAWWAGLNIYTVIKAHRIKK